MTDPGNGRRARRRATARQGAPRPARRDRSAASEDASETNPRRDRRGSRGEQDLAGSGASQVGPTGAMRARDLNRPDADDLAAAEAELVIVRRHWTPPASTPTRVVTAQRRPGAGEA